MRPLFTPHERGFEQAARPGALIRPSPNLGAFQTSHRTDARLAAFAALHHALVVFTSVNTVVPIYAYNRAYGLYCTEATQFIVRCKKNSEPGSSRGSRIQLHVACTER